MCNDDNGSLTSLTFVVCITDSATTIPYAVRSMLETLALDCSKRRRFEMSTSTHAIRSYLVVTVVIVGAVC